MKQKVATLDVYFDPHSEEPSGTGNCGNGKYILNINQGGENNPGSLTDRKQLQTIIAHELGHFVCLLTGDKTHDDANLMWHMFTGDASTLLPGERKAWELAHEIVPDLNRETEKQCLESYERKSWK